MKIFPATIKAADNPQPSAVWKNAHLWYIALIMMACSLFYYLDSILHALGWATPQWSILYMPHDFHRMLFAVPILYASYIFKTRGAIITTLISALIFLPRALFISPYPNSLLRPLFFCIVIGMVGAFGAKLLDEVTAHKKAEEALGSSKERLNIIFEYAPDGLYLSDLKGNFIDGNKAAEEITGYKRDELIGKNFLKLKLLPLKQIPKAAGLLAKNALRQSTGPDEFTFNQKNGTKVQLEISTFPVEIKGESLVLSIARDITERKKAEEERKNLEQRLQIASRLATVGEMASGIAHEINNPLTGVIGFSQLLMQKKDIPEGIREYTKIIHDGAQRMAGIVDRLLAFARQHKPERSYANINHIIEATLKLRAYEMETSNIKLTTQLDPDLRETMADAAQLQQVFLNIIINAEAEMKSAHGKGELQVKTEDTDNTIRISFKDDGPGIASENLEKVFDPFFTTREVGRGTGLGLSLCYGIIAEHRGRLYARSKLGQGATFIVELPVVAEGKQVEPHKPATKELKKVTEARILVVDDEPSNLQLLTQLLSSEGHRVETVESADAVLEKIKSERYNLILLDIKLPGMSGIELYKEIKRTARTLARRVVFITGDVIAADTRGFLSRAKAPYVTKPFNIEELKNTINRTLARG